MAFASNWSKEAKEARRQEQGSPQVDPMADGEERRDGGWLRE